MTPAVTTRQGTTTSLTDLYSVLRLILLIAVVLVHTGQSIRWPTDNARGVEGSKSRRGLNGESEDERVKDGREGADWILPTKSLGSEHASNLQLTSVPSVVTPDLTSTRNSYSFLKQTAVDDGPSQEFYLPQNLVRTSDDDTATGVNNNKATPFAKPLSNYYYDAVSPTTRKESPHQKIQVTSSTGEGERVARADTPPPGTTAQSATAGVRKTDPDIQEIITGFVKLLNGGGPQSGNQPPVRRRINNRGPPRISDLPPFVLDPLIPPPPPPLQPPQSPPTKDPPPYPFEKPVQKVVVKPFVTGVPIPEQIVPPKPSKLSTKSPIKPSPVKTLDTKKTSKPELPSRILPPSPLPPSVNKVDLNEHDTTSSNDVSSAVSTSATVTTTLSPSTEETTSPATTDNPENTPHLNLTQLFPKLESVPSSAGNSTNETIPTGSSNDSEVNITSLNSNVFNSSSSAMPIIESSIVDVPSSKESHKETTSWIQPSSITKHFKGGSSYSARPGIVLDDPEYRPGGAHARPIVTAAPPTNGHSFDVTVSAIQGPGSTSGTPHIYPVELEGVNLPGEVSVITKAQAGQHYVSIDGKRTYINLFGSTAPTNSAQIKPTQPVKSAQGTYSVLEAIQKKPTTNSNSRLPGAGNVVRRPAAPPPPVRIDTCIVGDWSTCDSDQHETCRTDHGVSSCHCAPAYSRISHRQPCKRIVSLFTSINLEKLYEQKLSWSDKFTDSESQEYLQLEYEAVKAMESAMSMTPFSDAYMGSKVNGLYTLGRNEVILNVTLELESTSAGDIHRPQIRQDLERHLMAAIRRRNFNLGTSALWASQQATVGHLQDLDECSSRELNDCFPGGECLNTFGSFECTCPQGYKDEHGGNPLKAGRRCHTCGTDYCNHRGTCSFNQAGQQMCTCSGNYYGSQCEVDGEVLGVAIGASVAAVIIILSTLACLCMWSRKWNKEAKGIGVGSPVFGYMAAAAAASSNCHTMKTPGVGGPYQVSMEDRLRWAQIADAIATNHYAPEPVGTRPPSAMFGYGTLPVAPLPLPRLRPGSVHNLRQESSSEEEDRVDLLGRNFHVPRPKSRSSLANQSGIYYDVDYDQQQEQLSTMKHAPIPLSTYTMGSRAHYAYH